MLSCHNFIPVSIFILPFRFISLIPPCNKLIKKENRLCQNQLKQLLLQEQVADLVRVPCETLRIAVTAFGGTMRDVNGRNATQKAALEAHSTNISIIEMDMNSDDAVTSGFADIIAANPVDILINNAGIMDLGLTEAFSLQQSRDLMETNYFGAIRATQAVLPGMRAAGSGINNQLQFKSGPHDRAVLWYLCRHETRP